MKQKHFQITIDNHKIAFALYLNDILLTSNRFHNACHNEFPINQYIYNGENALRLNLSINPHWSESPAEQWCKIVVTQYCGMKGALKPEVVSQINWKWDVETKFPVNLISKFTTTIPYGNWAWLDADIIHEENINMKSLYDYVTTLYTIMSSKDYHSLEIILKNKSIDFANAFYIPFSERLADQENFYKNELFSSQGWELEPLDLSNLMFDFHANNRLIHILKRNGRSPITSKPIKDNIFELELFLCHKNNQWILCR